MLSDVVVVAKLDTAAVPARIVLVVNELVPTTGAKTDPNAVRVLVVIELVAMELVATVLARIAGTMTDPAAVRVLVAMELAPIAGTKRDAAAVRVLATRELVGS